MPLMLVLAASLPAHAAGPTGFLNDTGQNTCYDGESLVACSTANSGDAATYPRQDGRFGRDAKAAAGTLTKTGTGAKGFDYTKVCFNGDLAGSGTCTGTLVANTTATATGSPTSDWACTKDNVTNLIWSLQSVSGDWTNYANTMLLPDATNAANRCGYNTGWRLPSRRELLSIVDTGIGVPAYDSAYFPGTRADGADWYWSADSYASIPSLAWEVTFYDGSTGTKAKDWAAHRYVRLVRSGQ